MSESGLASRWWSVLLGVVVALATLHVPASAASDRTAGPVVASTPLLTWSVTLTANPPVLSPGQSSTLTATANMSVTNTSLWMSIYDLTAGQYVALCGTGTTCTAVVRQNVPTTHNYIASVSQKPNPPIYPPPDVRAQSAIVSVTWGPVPITVSLAASRTTLGIGGTTTLVATTNVDVGPTLEYIEIFRVTDTTPPEYLTSCGSGTTCSVNFTETIATADSFIAYVSDFSTNYPPPNIQATSATSWVTWSNLGFTVSLSAATGSVTATATLPPSPPTYNIEIFDETTDNSLVALCANVPTCRAASVVGHYYVAFVSSPGTDTSLPPTDAAASSAVVLGR